MDKLNKTVPPIDCIKFDLDDNLLPKPDMDNDHIMEIVGILDQLNSAFNRLHKLARSVEPYVLPDGSHNSSEDLHSLLWKLYAVGYDTLTFYCALSAHIQGADSIWD